MIKKITISTLLLGCSGLAIAEDVVSPQADTADIPATQMESMQIRATAVAKPAVPVNLPATSEGVTSKQIQDGINVINTEDAIKYLPSVQVRKRYIGDTNSPVSTRTSGTLVTSRTLVYADHVLLSNFLGNGASFAPRFGLVSPEEIERIDLIYGPYSALYPGNSIGSVIQMTTRMPEKFEAHASIQAFTQNYELYKTDENFSGTQLSASLGGRQGDFSWRLSANKLNSAAMPQAYLQKPESTTLAVPANKIVSGAIFDLGVDGKPRVILGENNITRTIQDQAKVKLAYDFTPSIQAAYTLGYWQEDQNEKAKSYLRDNAGNPVFSGNVNINGFRYTLANTNFIIGERDREHFMHSLSLHDKDAGNWDWEVVATKYNFNKDIYRQPLIALPAADAGGAGQIADSEGTGWETFDLRTNYYPQGKDGEHQISLGYHLDEYVLETLISNTANWKTGSATTRRSAFAGKTQTQAIYAQDAWRFSPNWKATIGGRWENWEAFDGSVANATSKLSFASREDNFFSPKFSLSYQATPVWMLRGSIGQAYRMPTVSELFQGSITAGTIVNNDPNLKPENAVSTDLTVERDLGNGLLRASYFHENMKDALISQTNAYTLVTNIQNIDKIRTQGIELAYQGADVAINGLDLVGSLTLTRSRILENKNNPETIGNEQPRIPNFRATLSATYRQNDKLSYGMGLRYIGDQYNTLENNDVNRGDYGSTSKLFMIDVRANYRFSKNWRLSAGIENLNNYKFFAFNSAPQRTFLTELKFDY
ncbi:MAG: TonB-dependent receptor [Methylotenera sp.]|uniref:TonB-dependent receptor n=1 Tax=Methylotenera sp. TaxID=2051956 RepID=UPI0017F28419|nr:TonB-dependent receptor [Methylotenera sp.]NOU25133.1 TonB-dependent receptor [Methylotenera sp.]